MPDIAFRPQQEEPIRKIVAAPARLLVIQKTGWGKSSVYFIAARLLREEGHGPSVLISPLLALMRNQLAAAERMGTRALTINSDNQSEWGEIERQIEADDVDILLISPERLGNQRFRERVLNRIAAKTAMLVVDEAHCVSDWGHDFRPHYRRLQNILPALPANMRLLATTATANRRVRDDLSLVLGPNLEIIQGPLGRPSLRLQNESGLDQPRRLAWLAEYVSRLPGTGIIYTLTVRDAVQVARWLKSVGIDVEAYHAGVEDRPTLEARLLNNDIKALVATQALGMGFDKPDLGFVVHFQLPGSPISYYQQVGRAGRSRSAYGVLLSGPGDEEVTDFFIESAFPTPDEVKAVLAEIEKDPAGRTVPELMQALNLAKNRIGKTLDLLSLETPSPIAFVNDRWQLTAAKVPEGFWTRAERLTTLRKAEQAQMRDYSTKNNGLMEYLVGALDGEIGDPVTHELPALSREIPAAGINAALTFLRRTSIPVAPRKQWPPGGLPLYGTKGRIGAEHLAEEGRALSVWGDAGWGDEVRSGKAKGRFSDSLVDASAELIRAWSNKPTWVTPIPSLRNPTVVPEFAERLAAKLSLQYRVVLTKARASEEQKKMANSTQQARNVDGSLTIATAVPDGPVLLVDDVVNSRWTQTVAAWLLRSRGSGPVFPFVLSTTGHDDG